MKNTFYSTLEALFVLKIFKFLSWLFGPVEKRLNDFHKQNCVLLNSVQEFIETEAWLLLTFFQCLRNQIISINSICHILKVH